MKKIVVFLLLTAFTGILYAQESNCQHAISSQQFQQKLNQIKKNKNLNSSKVNSSKHLIQANKCFTAIQIKGIVDLFEYENSKLEMAMYAYTFTSNKQNYYLTLSKALGFDSSKKKLLDYINKQGK